MVRVKATGDDRTHLEMRGGSAASNPYLLAVRRAGRRPARRRGQGQPARPGPRYHQRGQPALEKFPQTLDAALDALGPMTEIPAALGEEFVRVFTAVKRFELGRFHAHVSDWEVNEYLELY